MRLLNTHTLKVEEFFDNAIPVYAILSHTWAAEEVTFQDMLGTAPSHKLGFQKLLKSCKLAERDRFDYIWIDTCCIDKTSSAELSEAINSMYRWYQNANVCYVYLSDVPETTDPAVPDSNFRRSRWFTRGWTLQELIAPKIRVFLSQSWRVIGKARQRHGSSVFAYCYDKAPDIEALLAEITGIDFGILRSDDMSLVSIARKMSWAAERQTTKIEDIAYCLMGIFGVNMPLLYGEGEKAFQRLQEEILKSSNDESLFAHTLPVGQFGSSTILARSPASFSGWGHIGMCHSVSRNSLSKSVPATLTSKGLQLQLPLCYNTGFDGRESTFFALLDCTIGDNTLARLAIPLARFASSKNQFSRVADNWLLIVRPTGNNSIIASTVVCRNGKTVENRDIRPFSIGDVRLETIYVTLADFYSRIEYNVLPYFRLAEDLHLSRGSFVLEKVYPIERWDSELGILQNPAVSRAGRSWLLGVLSFRDKQTSLQLDVIIGVYLAAIDRSIPSQLHVVPWCQVHRVDLPAGNLLEDSDARLREAFQVAHLRGLHEGSCFKTTSWNELQVAEVKFEETEFLGRQGYVLQVQIS